MAVQKVDPIILGVKLQVSDTDFIKQVNLLNAQVKKLGLGVKLNVTLNGTVEAINKEIKTVIQPKVRQALTVDLKVNSNVGYIKDQISALSKKIAGELTIKLKIDAKDLEIIRQQTRKATTDTTAKTGSLTSASANNGVMNINEAEFRSRLNSVVNAYKNAGEKIHDVQVKIDKDMNMTASVAKWNNGIGQMVNEVYKLQNVVDSSGKIINTEWVRISTNITDNATKAKTAMQTLENQQTRLNMSMLKLGGGKLAQYVDRSALNKLQLENAQIDLQGKSYEVVQKQLQRVAEKYRILGLEANKAFIEQQKSVREGLLGTPISGMQAIPNMANMSALALQKGAMTNAMNTIANGAKWDITEPTKKMFDPKMNAWISETGVRVWETATRFKAFKLVADEATGSFYKLGETVRNATFKDLGFLGQLQSNLMKFPVWLASATITMQFINFIRDGIKSVYDLNTALTQLNIVMDMSVEDQNRMIKSAQDYAKTMGTTVNEVMIGMKVYANQTESLDSILRKTAADIILSNLSGMSMKESTDTIQALTLQFKLADSQAMKITDTITRISASLRLNFQTAVQSISEAIQVSGTMANEAGMSLSKYASVVGVIVEKTRLGGSQVGNAILGGITV